jgi:hypothetical protein
MQQKSESAKGLFIASLSSQEPKAYPLSLDGLNKMARYYQNKYNIKIIINGQTSCGQTFIAAKQEVIERIEGGELPYTKYFKERFIGNKILY